MANAGKSAPVVLAISAHDPTGAAGIQADIEAIAACGAWCASLLTGLTAQNTVEFAEIYPQSPAHFLRAAEILLADMQFSACKIGVLGSAAIASCVADILPALGNVPVVLDPVLCAGTGTRLANEDLKDVMRKRLLPAVTLLTPNRQEALELAGTDSEEDAVRVLMGLGARNVLVTGGDVPGTAVVNVLYRRDAPPVSWEFERLPHRYHGSGCTLAAAAAAGLALGKDVETASGDAQRFTWDALHNAARLGRGQRHPARLVPVHGPETDIP